MPKMVRCERTDGNFRARRALNMGGAMTTETAMKPTDIDTDATHILAADHRAVEALFEEFEKANGTDRKAKIAEKICTELKIHAQIEEEVFYPALKGKIDDDLLK